MATPGDISKKDHRALPALLLGLSVGWLVGNSVAEVTGGVIASLLALAGGIGTALVTRRKDEESPVLNLWPIALIAIGVALGSTAGLVTRTHGWLAPGGVQTDEKAAIPVFFNNPAGRCEELRSVMIARPDRLPSSIESELGEVGSAVTTVLTEDTQLKTFVEALCDGN